MEHCNVHINLLCMCFCTIPSNGHTSLSTALVNGKCLPMQTDKPAYPAKLPDIISCRHLQETVQHKEVHMSTTYYTVQ